MPVVFAIAATLGFLSASPPKLFWQEVVVGLYVFLGYALPEVGFLAGRQSLDRANKTLEFAGLLGTVISLVLGLPKFGSSPDVVLSMFSVALLTTAVAQALMILNLTIARR